MHIFNKNLSDSLQKKSVLKVIAGLDNINIYNIAILAKAAELAKATYIDIVANTHVLSLLKSFIKLPICVSSIDSLELYNCYMAGADILEIGNFDVFYKKKIFFSSKDIVELAYETRKLIHDKDICVTIPYHLSLSEQIKLSKDLEQIGINIIQTESHFSKFNNNCNNFVDKIEKSAHKAADSLSSTYILANSTDLPIITSSGINDMSSSIAILYGASGIGVGSSIKKHPNISSMSSYIKDIMKAIHLYSLNNIDSQHCYKSTFKKSNDLYQDPEYMIKNLMSI
uniref:Uncharacterized protein ycf23 n=1 Tax=Anotrichium furcellatum TaxID=41999 RepID=A0A4D6WK57_9FLOR|nr:hypothetical protein [Anotrichium furcellatum]